VSKPRTVLLVIASLGGGGAERQLSEMANFWAVQGWKVILATWSGNEVADFYRLDKRVERVYLTDGSTARVSASRIIANLSRVMLLRRLLKSSKADAVLSFMTESNLLTIIAASRLRLQVVVSERVQPAMHSAFPWVWRALRRILYARADTVVAQTKDAAQWIVRYCRARVTVIPNALRPLPEPQLGKRPEIVAVGRLTHQKGFDLLLEAYARILPSFPEWTLAIIGEGEERDNLTRLCTRLGLDEHARFVGQTADILPWMERAALVVQPSRFEGFPNVLLEGMGLGAAVISSDCPSGPSDLIEEGVNGRLVPVDDVSTLAKVMADLMRNGDERDRLGRAALKVRERYRQDEIMRRWEASLFPQGVS
jgi:glycosyltransferase involved in cell wall biosynthesis